MNNKKKGIGIFIAAIMVISVFGVLIFANVSATVEPDVTTNPCDDGFIDFEEGTDGAVIQSDIPGSGVHYNRRTGLALCRLENR